jgi:hypothetical protein
MRQRPTPQIEGHRSRGRGDGIAECRAQSMMKTGLALSAARSCSSRRVSRHAAGAWCQRSRDSMQPSFSAGSAVLAMREPLPSVRRVTPSSTPPRWAIGACSCTASSRSSTADQLPSFALRATRTPTRSLAGTARGRVGVASPRRHPLPRLRHDRGPASGGEARSASSGARSCPSRVRTPDPAQGASPHPRAGASRSCRLGAGRTSSSAP